eukprot:CAMPEP_0167758878 /NCGR_PEP_ID=MMETSP0110_2-20121227/10715_1 /TAXON_ID=629695 /ORGANISM="Gymnochlora sp., Strain CCMP2014" /LENGTH=398 /DNA_ID=CAMNT_0007645207 /DNA_START=144 /DNA_END=1340 /DNA_ORIENTATION=-
MSLLKLILTFPARRPVAFGLGFSCIKTSAADLLVQRYVEKRKDIDWKRNSAFGLFGLLYLGGVQYFLYVPVFKRLFPGAEEFTKKTIGEKLKDTAGQLTMVKQVFLDQAIHHPLLYFPTFYMMKELVMGGKPNDAVKKYKANYKEDILSLWKIWVPATIVNFTFMPMWGRIPFVATVSLFWTCLLSYMRGSDPIDIPEQKVNADTWGNQGRALSMALNQQKAQLSPDRSYIVITSAGDSKLALTQLCKEVASSGGNVIRSTAMCLSGQIIATLVIETQPEEMPELASKLAAVRDCQVTINQFITPKTDDARFECHLLVAGGDRPGILSEISHFLDDHSIRIENLVQDQSLTLKDGKELTEFNLHLVLSSESDLDLSQLQTSLNSFGEEIGMKFTLQSK